MSFLRRLLGGGEPGQAAPPAAPLAPAELDALERQHERDLLAEEQARLDELQQRQLRYERYAWQPPAQGGERRAGDDDPETDG